MEKGALGGGREILIRKSKKKLCREDFFSSSAFFWKGRYFIPKNNDNSYKSAPRKISNIKENTDILIFIYGLEATLTPFKRARGPTTKKRKINKLWGREFLPKPISLDDGSTLPPK